MKTIMVIGAGLTGSTIARQFAEAGHKVEILERRGHVAGNAYDFVESITEINLPNLIDTIIKYLLLILIMNIYHFPQIVKLTYIIAVIKTS